MRILLCALIISGTYAENRGEDAREHFKDVKSFFDSDSARTSFQPEPERLDGPEWGVFNANLKRESLKEKLRREEEEERKKEEALLAAKMGGAPAQENTELASAEDVRKKFGDPEKEPEVLAQKDSPKPFQGMMAALQVGDEKLAQQYARQYARYMKTTQERVSRTTNLTGLAMATDGRVDKDSWAWSMASEAEKELFKDEVATLNEADPVSKQELSDKAKNLIRLALEEDDKPKTASKVDQAEAKGFLGTPEEQVSFARTQHRKSAIRDSKGEVDVFLFVDVKNRDSLFTAAHVERVFRKIQSDERIRFAALSVGFVSESDRQLFRKQGQLSYPVIDGSDLSKTMNISRLPSLVLVARNSGKAAIDIGRRGDDYILERIRLIQGGR